MTQSNRRYSHDSWQITVRRLARPFRKPAAIATQLISEFRFLRSTTRISSSRHLVHKLGNIKILRLDYKQLEVTKMYL